MLLSNMHFPRRSYKTAMDCIMTHICYATKSIVKWRQIALAKVVLNVVQRKPYDIDSGCVRNTR